MNHADVKKNLADYLEGDLPPATRARVDAHLDDCLECAEEVDAMQQTIRLLRTLPEPETPPMIAANVMRRIRAGETEPSFLARMTRSIGRTFEPTFVLPASAVAVAALVAMFVQDPSAMSRFMLDPAGPTETASLDSKVGVVEREPAKTQVASMDLALPFATARSVSPPASSSAPSFVAGPTAERKPAGPELRFEFKKSARQVPFRLAPTALARRVAPSPYRASLAEVTLAPGARRVVQPILLDGSATFGRTESAGGEDPRDAWLVRGLENPAGFAQFLAAKSIAEQELWVSRLAERAMERALLNELVSALRESGDVLAAILSDDFFSEADVSDADLIDWDTSFTR